MVFPSVVNLFCGVCLLLVASMKRTLMLSVQAMLLSYVLMIAYFECCEKLYVDRNIDYLVPVRRERVRKRQ